MNRTVLQRLLATLRHWHDRRLAIRALAQLDDHLLLDIGIGRHQIVSLVESNLTARQYEKELQASAEHPKPYPARPAGIHGPAARHWPQALQNATGANDGATPGKAASQTC